MLCTRTLEAALSDAAGEPVNVSRIEFEVLDNGAGRWTLWNGDRRLQTFRITERGDLIEALQVSGVILRSNMLVNTPEAH